MKIRTALFTVTLATVAGFVSSPINAELAKTESASTYQKIDERIAELNSHYASKYANMANLSERERAVIQTGMVREGKRITDYMTFTTLTRDEINNKKQGWLQGLKAAAERGLCEKQTTGSDWFYRPDFTHETVFSSSDGHEFLTASVGPFECFTGKLVKIPGGSFSMGENHVGRYTYPKHRVTMKSFYMQEHEVTWAQYQPCIDAGICEANTGLDEDTGDAGWGKGNRPFINGSWYDVQTYIGWLNKVTGQTFRLPSEAEWEYAARAGSTTNYSWGDDIADTNRANCDGCGSQWDASKTAPVKSFSANAWGLYDMHGNVTEWVQDCWHDSYQGAPTDGSAWTRDGDCSQRMLRGGAWLGYPSEATSSYRSRADRFETGESYFGFRLVQDL